MASWASDPTALGRRRFFRDKPRFAAELRLAFAGYDHAASPGTPLLPLAEPYLADDHELVWRMDHDLWRVRLFFFRGEGWLALEFRHNCLNVALRAATPEGPREGSFSFRDQAFGPLANAPGLVAEAERLQARARASRITAIRRFRFRMENGRVFDNLASCAKLRLLSEASPGFRFHVLEVDRHRALADPAELPLGALFEGAAREGRRPKDATAPPEHGILSSIYLFGGMKRGLRQGLDPLFAPMRALPRPAGGAFVLAVSLELEKRAWVEQVEGIAQALELLLAYHPRVEVLVNGMTGTVSPPPEDPFADIAAREREAMALICARLPRPVTLRHLHGQTLLEKGAALSQASYFIGPIGSASLLALALGLPGLLYGNLEMMRSARWIYEPPERMTLLPGELIRPVAGALGMRAYGWARGSQVGSYSIQPAAFLAHLAGELARAGLLPPAALGPAGGAVAAGPEGQAPP